MAGTNSVIVQIFPNLFFYLFLDFYLTIYPMRIYLLMIILLLSLASCLKNSGSDRNDSAFEKNTKRQAIAVTKKYIMGQLSDAKKTISKNGLITIGGTLKRYIIDPSRIFTGLIDDDQKDDAIVTVATFQGQHETMSEQLIILKSNNKFILTRALESDMRIISLKDRIITADVPEHSRNNPLFDCPSCWKVVKYRYKTGDLVTIE
jgi:hypothetical protein